MMFLNGADTVATGGCIRFGPDGIYLHENEAHDSVGIRPHLDEDGLKAVTPAFDFDHRGRLIVKHSAPGPVVTMGAFADESLVSRGVSLGCSGGGGTTVIQVALDGRPVDLRDAEDYKKVSGTYCNAWLFWLHRV